MSRLGLLDWIGSLRATSKSIDGLWIGISPIYWIENREKPEAGLRRIEEALCLIKTYDRLRYDLLTRDLERIWVRPLLGYAGRFNPSLNLCEVDCRFVGRQSADILASLIVHEATHARLTRFGIGYEEGIRARVEAVCIRRELAFAAKLPNGEKVREGAELSLECYAVPEFHTDAARERRRIEAGVRELRDLETPEWLISAVLRIYHLMRSIRSTILGIFNSIRRLVRNG